MARVYVSSTIADLKRERQAVMDWLVAAGHQPVHSYQPNSDTVRDSSLNDVDTCDLYVLILGHRYGFQPAEDNPADLSITHLEFRRAGESGIPRVALLRTSIPAVSLSDMENPERAKLVLAFRAEVARDVRPSEFYDKSALIQGLSTGVQAELAKRSAGAVGAGRALRLASPPALLVGREELITKVDDRLASSDHFGPRVVALYGLAGAGKTSVALEYARRHLAEAGVAWQFTNVDPAVLAAGFGELAAQLGAGEGAGDPVASVHTVLATYPAGWLLVFDNAPDRASVERFLPPAGAGRVLVTSRSALWPPRQAVEVPVLEREAAAGFLGDRTGDADRPAALELADELGELPLALEQAAAYIHATGDTLGGYLASFRQRRPEMLARGEPAGHERTVAATWSLAFEELEQSAPQAAGLLRLLACYASEAIPLRLLLRSRPGLAEQLEAAVAPVLVPLLKDELAAKDAVAALRHYSLVSPAAAGAVSVHRLVQAVTADHMSGLLAEAWRQAAASLIEAAIPDDPKQPDTWPVCAALLPHAQAVLAADSDGMAQIASYLGHSGNYVAARDLMKKIVAAQEQAGDAQHPRTLIARSDLADWTGEAGEQAAARGLFAELLPVQERVLGAENPTTLTARDSLARWTGEAGEQAAARGLFAELLPIRERVLGAEHAATLITRDSLARWTGEAGNPAAARDQFAELLPIRERVLGPEHPDTLTTRGSLAYWTGRAGDPAAARDQLAELVAIRERVLGPEHPRTLITRDSQARFTGEAGNAAAARDQFAALLPVEERVLGPENPHTLTTRGSLAHWTGAAGDPAAARDQFAALLPIRERVLGPEHPDTLITRDSQARSTGEAGNAAAARDQLAELLPVEERVLGTEHSQTLATRGSLAYWTGAAGDPAAARDQLAKLLPIQKRVLGDEHRDTLITRDSLARSTGDAGDAAAARDQLAELLPVQEGVLGSEHLKTLATLGSLAYWTGAAGDPAAARDQFAVLLPVQEGVLGDEHPDTLAARAWLARFTGDAGDAAAARDQLAELVAIREQVLGPEHPHTLATRGSLAYWTGAAGDPAAARDQFAELLPVEERVLGTKQQQTLATRSNLAYWTTKAADVT
jgi:Domain of unknown function (DUF4062)/Tetratricopeptide repeat